MNYVPNPTLGRIHVHDFQEFRVKYAPWVPDTSDAIVQDTFIKLYEPSGARGLDVDTGTLLFGRLFFPRAVKKLMTGLRRQFVVHLDDVRIPFLTCKAHRTFGKSTWVKIFAASQLAMRKHPHVLYTSSEYKLSKRSTDWIRSALTGPDFVSLFGDMKPNRGDHKGSASFSEDAFFLMDPKSRVPFALCSPRGSGQTVNGSVAPVNHDFIRVTLVINDDGQSRKNIHNAFIREEYEAWLEAELFQTVETDEQPGVDNLWPYPKPGQREPWRVIELDTPKHRLAAVEQHFSQEHWISLKYPAAIRLPDGTYKSAHEIYSDGTVNRMAARFRTKPDHWAREFLCEATSSESTVYRGNMFTHTDPNAVVRTRRGKLFKFLVVDPSRTGHSKANPTSILAVAIDVEGGKIFFLENVVECMEPEEYYGRMFKMCLEWGIHRIYCEDTGLANVLRQALKTFASMAGLLDQIEFIWLTSRRRPGVEYGTGEEAIKIARAAAPAPLYKIGAIVHAHSMRGGPLEKRLLEWPDCGEWGPTDTAGYVVEIMEDENIVLEGNCLPVTIVDQDEEDDFLDTGDFFSNMRKQRVRAYACR